MATYVLVHGGGHGGWCYQRVARILRSAGHDVYTPTLSGLGERSHLMGPDVELVLLPALDAGLLYGVTDPTDLAWMADRLTGHPWKCFEQQLRLTNEAALWSIPQYHLVCTSTLATRDREQMNRARAEGRLWDIDTGHDLMITEPRAVADALLEIASA